MIADDALAHHVFNVLHVTPVHGIAVLQPDEGSTNVSWNVFKVVTTTGCFAPAGMKIFVAS
jgi:hypothetical protein